MKVLIDTNILLDVLCKREDLYKASSNVLRLCEIGKIEGVVSSLSIANIIYILRKKLNKEDVCKIVDMLSMILTIVDLKQNDLKNAAEFDYSDYEDAIQIVTAIRVRADYIITRNIKDFKNCPVEVMIPEVFIS